jgi:hypothetical protein
MGHGGAAVLSIRDLDDSTLEAAGAPLADEHR